MTVVDLAIMTIRSDLPRERKHFSADLRRRLSDRQGGRCVYCGYEFGIAGRGVTIDHMVPVSMGGGDDEGNLQGLCRQCNNWKGDHTDIEFRERIRRGLTVLKIRSKTLDRATLHRVMIVTRMHEDVARRRTRRFRHRWIVLVVYCYALATAGYWSLLDWPYLFAAVDPLKYVVFALSWAFAIAIYVRAAQHGYLRWNPGRG